ncbi:204_t:CDS:2 [Ambispora leptoticha]|uniref:204_t:CDS:1 n=1 Tax=Ambispora leptoticha TaxID=144679 RepID=A0A9N9AI17_9GLOM|nr:204_t:CDS:2 [Ambispora leptoticha]
MAQSYRIQDSRSGKRIQPQSIQDKNTGVARNRFSRRGDRISRTTNSKHSGRSDVISFSVEEAGETSLNSNEPAPTIEEVIESSDSEKEKNNEQIQPEIIPKILCNPSTLILLDDGETSMNNEESAPSIEAIELSDNEEKSKFNPKIPITHLLKMTPRMRHNIRPQTEEEREYSSPREGFTKDTIVIRSRCSHGMENGMCVLYCGHAVCGDWKIIRKR